MTNLPFPCLKKGFGDLFLLTFSLSFFFVVIIIIIIAFRFFLFNRTKIFNSIACFLLIFTRIPSTTMIIGTLKWDRIDHESNISQELTTPGTDMFDMLWNEWMKYLMHSDWLKIIQRHLFDRKRFLFVNQRDLIWMCFLHIDKWRFFVFVLGKNRVTRRRVIRFRVILSFLNVDKIDRVLFLTQSISLSQQCEKRDFISSFVDLKI